MIDDVLHRSSGQEDLRHTRLPQRLDVFLRYDTASDQSNIGRTALVKHSPQTRQQRQMGTRKNADTDDVDVLFERGCGEKMTTSRALMP